MSRVSAQIVDSPDSSALPAEEAPLIANAKTDPKAQTLDVTALLLN
jgi:hypothetical protein